jgi:DNA-binding response OmpR family regulator
MATILLVDENEEMRRLLFCALAINNTVLEAADGAEALMLAELARPDLIIIDPALPVMSGIDLVRILRAQSARVKILIHAQWSTPVGRALLLNAGADLFLAKPAALDDLTNAITRLLTDPIS